MNVVINNIPIFYLSFFEAQKVIANEVLRIQQTFLWGGREVSCKLNCISWENAGKFEGGLGVKHIERFNMVILSK